MSKSLISPSSHKIAYLGPDLESGALPAFLYFALSAQESLELHPYNQPPSFLSDSSLRVFSWTLPGHGEGYNKHNAMHYWAHCMAEGTPVLEHFFDQVKRDIYWLFEKGIIDPKKIAVGGLSRGGFIATHLAARIKEICIVLAFAPVTELMYLKEFSELPILQKQANSLNSDLLVSQLSHLQFLRFYIGNLDTRVNTDACYHFIRHLAQHGHQARQRHQTIELRISQSIGHKGHGTDPQLFKEGALWIKQLLLQD